VVTVFWMGDFAATCVSWDSACALFARNPSAKRLDSRNAPYSLPCVVSFAAIVSPAGRGQKTVADRRCYTIMEDADLMASSAAGDRHAFGELVSRHGSFALRVASRVISNSSIAEEVVQEAMMRAWEQSTHFDPRRARFSTWLYRIVVNMCLDHRRRIQPAAMPEGFEPVDPTSSVQDKLELDERDTALAKAMKALPAPQRAAMALVYDGGMSGAEAARIMGVSAKAVERHLARARASLRESLRAKYS
jgi:RNA polymerase sigma-70 factor, ECF subfamily